MTRPNAKPGHARVRRNDAAAPRTRQVAARGAPDGFTTIAHRVDCACADMAVGKWRAQRGDLERAVLLLRRAQHELVQAELALLEQVRVRGLARVQAPGKGT